MALNIQDQKYIELFISESWEHLNAMDAGLITLEKTPNDQEVMKDIMRHAHTLKGIAASIGYGEVSNLAHSFEGMVENVKNNIATGGFDLLFGAVDELKRLVELISNGKSQSIKANPLVDDLGEMEKVDKEVDKSLIESPEKFLVSSEVKVRIEKLDNIMEFVSELMVNRLLIDRHITNSEIEEKLKKALYANSRIVDSLQALVLQLRLNPIGDVYNRFPRMVRDLAKKQNKEINLSLEGEEIEIDRTILDGLGEPLVHLLRNSIDHGIKEKGTIHIKAERVKDKINIIVEDDGAGIDWVKVREKKEKTQSVLDDVEFLFSGVSTSDHVTEVSGRGVGLSAVKKKVESFGGKITVDLNMKKGTKFIMTLPVSMAIVKALIAKTGKSEYAIPLSSIERLVQLKSLKIQKQADQEFTVIDNVEVPILRVSDKLGIEKTIHQQIANQESVLLLSKVSDLPIGLVFDEVISQQDVVVKPVDEDISRSFYFSATTILGDGHPVPIIDLESLVNLIKK